MGEPPAALWRARVLALALIALAGWQVARSEAAAPAFPASGRVRFAVSVAGGLGIGRAEHGWRIEAGRYRLHSTLEATGVMALFKPERLLQESEGRYDAAGFAPLRFRVIRNGKPAERADFDRARGLVRLEHRDRVWEAAVARGAQDVLSVFYQVALFPPAAAGFEADVATGKGAYRRVFRRIGEERIELPVGELRTLKVRAEQADGERIDLWLALDRNRLPVRIRMVDRKGNAVEQQAVEIDVPDPGSGASS
ncbi:MAG: hypothetical protein OHK0026_01990 [Rhodocyclaceae bacterium]